MKKIGLENEERPRLKGLTVSLLRAITVIAVLISIVFGGSESARADAGHVHASAPGIEAARLLAQKGLSRLTPAANAEAMQSFLAPLSLARNLLDIGTRTDATFTLDQSHRTTDCASGACCPQGASSCGMAGHCCAGALPQAHTWWSGNHRPARFRMPAQDLIYQDISFDLDRPPKA